jgi:ATP sulfurylase
MIHYVDVEGAITDVHHDDKWFNVRFKSGAHWSYPVDLSMKQIEKNEQAEVPVDLNELFNQIKSL